MAFLVGTDTGGTFTDCVVVGEDGALQIGKAPSTPPDFAQGVLDSLENTLGDGNGAAPTLDDASAFLHGATVALNAIITRRGAKVGMLTTRGHRDALFFMRSTGRVAGLSIAEVYDYPRTGKPEPIVPKYLIEEIDERVDYKGAVVVPLNEETARRSIQRLLDQDVEAIAINLLWCFKNAEHERRLEELVTEIAPEMPVAVASRIVPKSGEYERGATTVMNAYTVPLVSRYVERLDNGLRERELRSPLLVMQTSGGVLRADEAVGRPVYTLNSGPAGGVIGALPRLAPRSRQHRLHRRGGHELRRRAGRGRRARDDADGHRQSVPAGAPLGRRRLHRRRRRQHCARDRRPHAGRPGQRRRRPGARLL